ncbi:hypothetical protein [Streptantibioticus ferralitis]|uniref:Uncharacterized protein n=1 Tax=Streptantibioticus ferralitis TaxID=236510 RepID=A0ABT5Z0R9_9ACTN|nr:hypothetical protein [Streptantibioticus ferralitis]MDF2257441.1 hypothetical protein [Streptantibioticus ferralitis]
MRNPLMFVTSIRRAISRACFAENAARLRGDHLRSPALNDPVPVIEELVPQRA